MTSQKAKDKIFRVTSEDDTRINYLIQYAYKSGHIAKPTLQEFMVFSIRCANDLLQEHYKEGEPKPRRRAIV